MREKASAARLNKGMRIAVQADEQSRRDPCREHCEYRISTFAPERSGKARFWQIPSGIERNRHTAGSWFDRAILSNRQIAYWAINPNAKLPAGAPGLGQSIHFFLHRSEHRLFCVAGGRILHGILQWFSHEVILAGARLPEAGVPSGPCCP